MTQRRLFYFLTRFEKVVCCPTCQLNFSKQVGGSEFASPIMPTITVDKYALWEALGQKYDRVLPVHELRSESSHRFATDTPRTNSKTSASTLVLSSMRTRRMTSALPACPQS